jgi:S-adenosylmethionine hydrolase
MKGVIFSIAPQATIVDLSHAVPPQDIAAGALVLEETTPWFPPNTIHVAVVDPGVGTSRAIVYAHIGSQHFIAPDNGLLGRVMARGPVSIIRQITNSDYWLPEVSHTFHGRDIMAPVAARLALGLDPALLGPEVKQVVRLALPEAVEQAGRIRGQVISVDSFGNLATNIPASMLAGRPTDSRACIVCGLYETYGIYRTFGEQSPGMLVALVNSSRRIELALVGDNAAGRLSVGVGTPIVIAWE